MPINLKPMGTGRKDYSKVVSRVMQYIPKEVPAYDHQNAIHYYATVSVPANTSGTIAIYKVPENQILSVLYGQFTNNDNVQMTCLIGYINPYLTHPVYFAGDTYYGIVEMPIPNGFSLTQNDTLLYTIINPNDVPITVNVNIQCVGYATPVDDTYYEGGFGGGGGSATGGSLEG